MTRDEVKTNELLDYYRSQVKQPHARDKPPPGFWIKERASDFVWGLLSDGDLIPKGKEDDYDDTVRACWDHYDDLHSTGRRDKAPHKQSQRE